MDPSSLPAHSTWSDLGEGASAVSAPAGSGVTLAAYLPAADMARHICRMVPAVTHSGRTHIEFMHRM